MVRESLDALIQGDPTLARAVMQADDEVDRLNRDILISVQNAMSENSLLVERGMSLVSATRNLERIADLATNIAEDVIFMADGTIIRHRAESIDLSEE
jgi:phosphate transport system protein